MEVVSIILRHVRLKLRRPVKHASHARTETDNLIVSCQLSDGKIGYGEGVPREYVTGETLDGAFDVLKSVDLKKLLLPAADFETAVRNAESFQLPAIPGDDRNCRSNAARCAVELAYLDAFGQSLGEPLMNATKLIAPELYEPRERVQYSGIILSAKGWKARLAAIGYRVMGFRQVKVKVGIAGHDDAKRLKAIRRCVGSAMDLRVDANEAWGATDAVEKILALDPFGVRCVEQPVPHEQVKVLKLIRESTGVPILLDESLCSMVDAEQAVQGGFGDLFNLRLSKCGGFIPTLKLAAFALQNGLGYQLGCQVGESGILSAAGRQFATSVKQIRHLEGSFDRYLLPNSLLKEDISFSRRGGWAPMLPGTGIGARIDPAQLDAATVRREVLFA